MTLHVHAHLVGEPLGLNYWEPLELQPSENLPPQVEIGLVKRVRSPRNPMTRESFPIEERQPDLARIERLERFDFEPPAG